MNCEWEIVAPPSVCGKPAIFCTRDKFLCQEHGEILRRRFGLHVCMSLYDIQDSIDEDYTAEEKAGDEKHDLDR